MTDHTTPGRAGGHGRPATGEDHAGPVIRRIHTGVPGLDAVLGGGLPEFSFNMLAGGPGAGKTTLAQQIIFANATVERPALYFTVLGEPTVKMLRYQQQFRFFDAAKVGSAVHYLNLTQEVLSGDLSAVLARVAAEVERLTPSLVVVDSFRTIRTEGEGWHGAGHGQPLPSPVHLEQFVQRLALHLTSWEVTSLLIGEYGEAEQRQPLFTIADGILWLTQEIDRNSVVRKLQAVKVRGQAQMPGLHTFRISQDGLQVFPRIPEQQQNREQRGRDNLPRLSTGVPGLDAIMGGGIPEGDAVMLAGPTGTGKSTFGMLFATAGLQRDEAVVVAGFEEYPEAYLHRLGALGVDAAAMVARNRLRISYLRPLDLSVDETLADILENVRITGARRVVIDSLTGFEIALAPTFRADFRESLYRLVGALTATGVTVFMVHEALGMSHDLSFTRERVSFVTDDIIMQRYIEIDGALEKVLSVVKMRRSEHSQGFWRYRITATGAAVGEPLVGYRGILGGSPEWRPSPRIAAAPGLTVPETTILDSLVRAGESSLAAVAASAGVTLRDAEGLMQRLVALEYVREARDGGNDTIIYRAIAHAATT